jgi:hypothetical protein
VDLLFQDCSIDMVRHFGIPAGRLLRGLQVHPGAISGSGIRR